MINASELKKIAFNESKDIIDKCLVDIEDRITNVAKAGGFYYTFNGNKYDSGLLRYVASIIEDAGFKVNYNNYILEISWYDATLELTPVFGIEEVVSTKKESKKIDKSDKK